ncbi:MAG: methyltransferase domain-containing protein [Candidatus Omnitrophica bacterium]|nr:hypothetical protein [bacterium]NUN94777.1 methyltransferase domain-containing protein [Candidatus Omnitrophota bacterium]
MKPAALFLREFVRAFKTTGAILPSGRALAGELARPLLDLSSPRRILEAGPGTGPVSDLLIRGLGPEDELHLCEVNPVFARHLAERLDNDPAWGPKRGRVRLHQRDVRDLFEPGRFHLVVSGLPLNNFGPELVDELLGGFLESLAPGGCHTFFEYIAIRALKRRLARSEERSRFRAIEQVVRSRLTPWQWHRKAVWINIPPAWAYAVRRSTGGSD